MKIKPMNKFLFLLCIICLGLGSPVSYARDVPKPEIMLAKVYHQGLDLNDYWVSEKYDGVRALWDGEKFISRGGNIYHAPDWFIADFPKQRLDGELWISRQSFELLVSTVSDRQPDDNAWRKVKFMVFDIPDVKEPFSKRIPKINTLIQDSEIPWLKAVEQSKVTDHDELMRRLELITKHGAEGLMLHKGSALYRAKRSGDLLKVKSHDDAEATVIAHIPGKGKYTDMLGAIRVETKDAKVFKIGTGFTDEQRHNPPEIGAVITFRYRGKTKNGIPKFASFLRVRTDESK